VNSCQVDSQSDTISLRSSCANVLREGHQIIAMVLDIGRAMAYLDTKGLVHRDLAARNILVDEHFKVKLADFGLGRFATDDSYYVMEQKYGLPFKSTAPEALRKKKFSSQSDVWSFGILLWEMIQHGDEPYPGVFSIREILKLLATGERLEVTEECPPELLKLMNDCWVEQPKQRPTFSEIVSRLSGMEWDDRKQRIEIDTISPKSVGFNVEVSSRTSVIIEKNRCGGYEYDSDEIESNSDKAFESKINRTNNTTEHGVGYTEVAECDGKYVE